MKLINIITEQTTSDFYSAMLGYLDQYGDQIVSGSKDKMKMIAAKKEVMIYCESLRDGKQPRKFTLPESTALYNSVMKMLKNSNITTLIDRGKTIKHSV